MAAEGITQTIVHTPVGRASVLLHASMGSSKSKCIIILTATATTKTKGKHFALCIRFDVKKRHNAWPTTCAELIRVWQFGRPLLPRGCNDNAVDNDNNSSMRCCRSIKNNKQKRKLGSEKCLSKSNLQFGPPLFIGHSAIIECSECYCSLMGCISFCSLLFVACISHNSPKCCYSWAWWAVSSRAVRSFWCNPWQPWPSGMCNNYVAFVCNLMKLATA